MSFGSWMRLCTIEGKEFSPRSLRRFNFVPPTALFKTPHGGKIPGLSHANETWLHSCLDCFGYRHRVEFSFVDRWMESICATKALLDYLGENDLTLDEPWTAVYLHGTCLVIFAFKSSVDAVKARMFL